MACYYKIEGSSTMMEQFSLICIVFHANAVDQQFL